MKVEEALEMVKSGRVDVFSIDVGRLVAEVREAGSIEEWGEKLSKLIDLLWLKLDALARKVFGLGGRVDSTVRVNRQVTVPWFSLRDLKEALRKLREASSKRGREEGVGAFGVEGCGRRATRPSAGRRRRGRYLPGRCPRSRAGPMR